LEGGGFMRKVRCYECGKQYDYDEDGFCPKCGAFNLPSADGRTVVREDGINERNHANSFVHAELHQEDRKRRNTPLETRLRPEPPQREKGETKPQMMPLTFFVWVIFLIIFFNILKNLLFLL
jgi:hypothetical protein